LEHSVGPTPRRHAPAAKTPFMIFNVISRRRLGTAAFLACWLAASAGVWAWTVAYGTTTAQPTDHRFADPAPQTPGLPPSLGRPTLYLFLHPRCPCTRATIAQLQQVLMASGLDDAALPEVTVVSTLPSGTAPTDDAWRHSETVRLALQLPNAALVEDPGGSIARRFGAVASGSVVLYSTDGRLLFAGGVTVSRGHEGDSLGAANLRRRLLNPDHRTPFTAPALGCRLCLED
jgi:hypothetical protein